MRKPTHDEVEPLKEIAAQLELLNAEMAYKLAKLRRECGAPAGAMLDEIGLQWVHRNGTSLHDAEQAKPNGKAKRQRKQRSTHPALAK